MIVLIYQRHIGIYMYCISVSQSPCPKQQILSGPLERRILNWDRGPLLSGPDQGARTKWRCGDRQSGDRQNGDEQSVNG